MLKEKFNKFKSSVTNNPSFTVREQFGYAAGIFGNSMGQDSTDTFSTKFFRNFMGITPGRMTLMQNVQYVLNIITEPIAGNVLDRPTKPGTMPVSKKILKYTPVPFALASMLLFVVPSASVNVNFIWAMVIRIIFKIVDAFYDMSLNTMSLRMTTNAKDRKSFYTIATLAAALGSMLPGWVIPIIVDRAVTSTAKKWRYFFIALVFCILGVTSMGAPYFTLNEKVSVLEKDNDSALSWDKEMVMSVLHNRPFIIMQIGNFFEQFRKCSYELLLYIYEDVFDDYSLKTVIDMISGGLSYVGLGAVPVLTSKLSPRTVMSLSYTFTGLFYATMTALGLNFNVEKIRKRRFLIGGLIAVSGMPNQAISAAKKIVLGDSTDYMEWYAEKRYDKPIRAEGLICTAQSLCGAAFGLVVTNVYNPLFKTIGYKESVVINGAERAVQSAQTLKGLYRMFGLFGTCGNLLAATTYLFDNFTGARRQAILDELVELRKARALAQQRLEGELASEEPDDQGSIDL